MTLPLTPAERSASNLVPGVNGWAVSTAVPAATPANDASILAIQQALAAVEGQVTAFDARINGIETDGLAAAQLSGINTRVETLENAETVTATTFAPTFATINTRIGFLEANSASSSLLAQVQTTANTAATKNATQDAAITLRPLMRVVYLFDTLANLTAVNRHSPNAYALIVDGNERRESNGTDTWSVSVVDVVAGAADNGIFIRGNLTLAAGTAYLRGLGGKGMTYEELGESIA